MSEDVPPALRTDVGERRAAFPERSAWVSRELKLGAPVDDDANVSVQGFNLDDEQSAIEVTIHTDAVNMTVDLPPEVAREVADDLLSAADFADGKTAE